MREILWFALILIAAGGLLTVYALCLIRRAVKAKQWHRAQGSVISSKIDEMNHMGSDADVAVRANIQYQYTVNGTTYRSKRVFFGDMLRSSVYSRANRYLAKYPVDAKVNVYYDLHKPRQAVLEPGVKPGVVFVLCFGCLLLAVGVYLMSANVPL